MISVCLWQLCITVPSGYSAHQNQTVAVADRQFVFHKIAKTKLTTIDLKAQLCVKDKLLQLTINAVVEPILFYCKIYCDYYCEFFRLSGLFIERTVCFSWLL